MNYDPTNALTGEARFLTQASKAPRLPWHKFVTAMDWKQGEHVLVIAKTGAGKTVLVNALALTRPYVVVVVTKPQDSSALWLKDHHDFRVARTWDETRARFLRNRRHGRFLLWPDASDFDSKDEQRRVIHEAFVAAWEERNWTVCVDEAQYVHDHLRLGPDLAQLFLQGRSLGISLVASSQRPFNLGREAISQSTHLLFLRSTDVADLNRIEEVVGRANAELIRELVPNLELHQVLYVNTLTGEAFRTRVPSGSAPTT